MNCSTCHFCGSYHCFSRRGRSTFGFKCRILNEVIFQVGLDEAKMMGVEVMEDFRNEDKWYHTSYGENLYLITPPIFDGIDAEFYPDRVAFWAWVTDHPCIAEESDLYNYMLEHREWARGKAKEMRDIREELEYMLDDVREAARMRRSYGSRTRA